MQDKIPQVVDIQVQRVDIQGQKEGIQGQMGGAQVPMEDIPNRWGDNRAQKVVLFEDPIENS